MPQQAVRGLPLEVLEHSEHALRLRTQLPDGQVVQLEGSLDAKGFAGLFTQGAAKIPFRLERGARPAPTAVPLPEGLEEHEVGFENGSVHLAGTLTLPTKVSRPPVAVLITGSGPQNRNEEVFGFRIFEALAHALAQAGIASLRYDDRGIGGSTGDFHSATTADFATDAEAAARFLKSQGARIDVARIGLIGHSEGGLIAPMISARNGDIRFIVLLAAPAQPTEELLLEQIRRVSRAEGMPAATIEENVSLSRRGFELVKTKQDLTAHRAELGDAAIRSLSSPWFQFFLSHDALSVLGQVHCPLLAISGSLDLQVPSDLNLPLIQRAMKAAKNEHAEVVQVEGMNHLMQAAKTGAVSEYAKLPKELMPAVTERITRWVLAL